jgi:hypothetical protein
MKLLSISAAAVTAMALLMPVSGAPAASNASRTMQGKHIANCIPGRPSPHCPPHYGRPWPYPYWYYGYRPWPGYGYYPPFYSNNPYYDEDFHVANRMTCNYAKGLMERRGYRSVRATDCSGTHYGFTGLKKGHKYKITLNSYSGRYSVVHIQ